MLCKRWNRAGQTEGHKTQKTCGGERAKTEFKQCGDRADGDNRGCGQVRRSEGSWQDKVIDGRKDESQNVSSQCVKILIASLKRVAVKNDFGDICFPK